ncbi:hypothetical protein [Amycolatopsis azurea]|uniref:Uncharacterized protein n=1 Tax=Amycolatopsis azurea DSM 43854 TaxID=1238180 RepID=M2Q4Q6_9PSEU|nr:hypothetical protein [Amycolatopsis azurea]EMD21776.1 hypothetical protein C791_0926 [Amycolatopsis azurea DSM 43854]OOC00523.1 hypothetical protein B0293_42740 [Amycolatopsis azurea DSM 43854]
MVKARRLAPGTAVTLAAAASYFCVQLAHTLRDRNRWPFCAYNMFNYHVPDRCEQLRVVFYDSGGRTAGPTDPW